MFVCLGDGNAEGTAKYIKKVTYHLHPTFKPSVIPIAQAPFLIARVGWGYFEIEVEITFVDKLKMKPMKLTHELNFDRPLTQRTFFIEVDEKNFIDGTDQVIKDMAKLSLTVKK